MTHTVNLVREFHKAFGHPVADKPNPGDRKLRELRVKLIAEELCELCEALGVALTIQCNSDFAQTKVSAVKDDEDVNLIEAADALGDLDYVVQGANLVFGFPARAIIREIQRSNMSKLGADGKPIYREDGKIMKGPNYSPPDIASIIATQFAFAPLEEFPSEEQMREANALWPKSEDELTHYIDQLINRPHDYGTAVYAISLAATATFHYVASTLGCTGFQAGCADLDLLRRTRMIEGPFAVIKAEDALFPVSGPEESLQVFLNNEAVGWIRKRAQELLNEEKEAHPKVIEHWKKLVESEPDAGKTVEEAAEIKPEQQENPPTS